MLDGIGFRGRALDIGRSRGGVGVRREEGPESDHRIIVAEAIPQDAMTGNRHYGFLETPAVEARSFVGQICRTKHRAVTSRGR